MTISEKAPEQRYLEDNLFEVRYNGRVFLVAPYPFRAVEIDRPVTDVSEVGDELRDILHAAAPTVPPFAGFGAVEFISTTHCNLRCTHCTARALDDDDTINQYYGMGPKHMSRETMFGAISAAVSQLRERLKVYPVRYPVFEMFITGGEPILVWNDLREALAHARKLLCALPDTDGYTFTPHIVTNGTLIDEQVARELVEAGAHVTVALDSPVNQVRVYPKGEAATPDAIVGLKNLVAAGHKNASVNVVIAGEDMDRVEEVMGYLENLGAFEGVSSIQLSPLAPPIAHTAHAAKGLSTRMSGFNSPAVCDAFSGKLIEYSRRYNIDMKGYAGKVGAWMQQGGTQYRCPVAEWKWVVTPEGDVYACHQLVGIDQFKMGNIQDPHWYDASLARSVRDRFLARTTDSADLCQGCVLKSTCMVFVDCPARSFLEMGDEHTVTPHYCQCGKTYIEHLFVEHLTSLIDTGEITAKPLSAR